MRIRFSDGQTTGITLSQSPLKNYLEKMHKHLQHITIPFRRWHRPCDLDMPAMVDNLEHYAKILNIPIDRNRCLGNNAQEYFNALHEIFEKNYDGDPAWHDYHESIHFCEDAKLKKIRLVYRDLSVPLEVKFDRDWLCHGTTKIRAGDVYVMYAELGKTPYRYWRDQEPNDIARICELSKPWLSLRANLEIALVDQDLGAQENFDAFLTWWTKYQASWCSHWQISNWQPMEQFTVIPVGRVDDLSELLKILDSSTTEAQSVYFEKDSDREDLHVELEIWASWASHPPSIQVSIDDCVVSNADLTQGMNLISFDYDFSPGAHDLVIKRLGATPADPTQKVEIKKLTIDDLDLDQLILKNSFYRPSYPEPWATQQRLRGIVLEEVVPYETVLGHDGTWSLGFFSPFYPHFLETSRAKYP